MIPNDPKFHKPQANANPGCSSGATILAVMFFIMIAIGMSISGGRVLGSVGSIVMLLSLVFGVSQAKKARNARAGGTQATNASYASPDPGEARDRKEKRERFFDAPVSETKDACDNPEPHRHFDTAPKEVYRPPVVNSPDQIARRLRNRKELYEAGLLTKEEYDTEVRKIRSSAN